MHGCCLPSWETHVQSEQYKKQKNGYESSFSILIIDFEEKFSEWVLGCSCWNLGMFFLIPNKNKTSTEQYFAHNKDKKLLQSFPKLF